MPRDAVRVRGVPPRATEVLEPRFQRGKQHVRLVEPQRGVKEREKTRRATLWQEGEYQHAAPHDEHGVIVQCGVADRDEGRWRFLGLPVDEARIHFLAVVVVL